MSTAALTHAAYKFSRYAVKALLTDPVTTLTVAAYAAVPAAIAGAAYGLYKLFTK